MTVTTANVGRPPAGGAFWTGWSIALGAGALILTAAVLPPFVGETARHVIMAAFSGVCHQIADRSPHINGVQLAVCHRCIGIYGALAAAPFAYLGLRRWDGQINRAARWLIVGAIAIPGIDWMGDWLGWWTNTTFSRVSTGAVFGLTTGYFLCRALVELGRGRRDQAPSRDTQSGTPVVAGEATAPSE